MKVSRLFVILVLIVAPIANADSVLIGNTPVVSPALAVTSNEFLAQPFVLTGTVSISEVDVTFISNDPNSLFHLEITDALGINANVLAESFFSTAQPFNPPPMMFSIPVNRTLSPGTYYIVASTPSGSNGGGWMEGVPPTVGNIPFIFFANYPDNDGAFPAASDWGSWVENANFQVIGTQVPEPGTLWLLCAGILAIWVKHRIF